MPQEVIRQSSIINDTGNSIISPLLEILLAKKIQKRRKKNFPLLNVTSGWRPKAAVSAAPSESLRWQHAVYCMAPQTHPCNTGHNRWDLYKI